MKVQFVMPLWLERLLKGLSVGISLLFIAILFSWIDASQDKSYHPVSTYPVKSYEAIKSSLDIDSLINLVGPGKQLPSGYEKQALIALSAYPELRPLKITFTLNESSAALEANFRLESMFGKRENRHYEILINVSNEGFIDPIKLHNLPFDAQIAILSHELGHIVYYHRLNLLQIANWGIQYLINPNYRSAHERSTDLAPVWRGLGYQIHYYAWYVRNDEKSKPFYDKYGYLADTFYMNDRELKEEMDKMKIYDK